MKKECKDILDKYMTKCQSKVLKNTLQIHSIEHMLCHKLIQDYQKCMNLKNSFKNFS